MKIASVVPKAAIVILAVAHAALFSSLVQAQASPPPVFSGMVWRTQGDWHVNGSSTSVRLGEAMVPGSLITAGSNGPHSLTVLMPDGQRLLCECFEARACAQGFRVPAVVHPPAPPLWDMFVGVRNVLLLRPATATSPFPAATGRAEMAGKFEIVAPLQPEGKVSIAVALRDLPAGHYLVTAVRYGQPGDAVVAQPLWWKKAADQAEVKIATAGVYRIQVNDSNQVPRLDIEALVAPANSVATETAALQQTRKTVLQWSAIQPGWSMHDFLRVYLESRSVANAY